MDLFANRPPIKVDKPMPHELVYRLFVEQLEKNYKEGWLYYRCKDSGLLTTYQELSGKKVFDQLKGPKHACIDPVLTIELVPQTCWFSNVRSNVTKDQWNHLKKLTAKKANHRCQICGGRGPKWPVECHEIWHYDDKTFIQQLKGLIALCPSCHHVKHMGFAQISGKEVEITCHLAVVNKWTYKTACQYVDHQFDIWKKRSQYDWLLDISWLNNVGIEVQIDEVVSL